MPPRSFEIRICNNCGLRYPLTENHHFGVRCPACLGETQIALKHSLSKKQNNTQNSKFEGLGNGPSKGLGLALLDNIRSAWNVGSIFRTADGLGVKKLLLCGITPTPDNEAVTKTSLGAENFVDWESAKNAISIALSIKDKGYTLIALEQDKRAIPIREFDEAGTNQSAILVGNEVTGIDPELLDLSDYILQIPMQGDKRSLNVEVAFGIAVSQLNLN